LDEHEMHEVTIIVLNVRDGLADEQWHRRHLPSCSADSRPHRWR
jgi:hypothetical protein